MLHDNLGANIWLIYTILVNMNSKGCGDPSFGTIGPFSSCEEGLSEASMAPAANRETPPLDALYGCRVNSKLIRLVLRLAKSRNGWTDSPYSSPPNLVASAR